MHVGSFSDIIRAHTQARACVCIGLFFAHARARVVCMRAFARACVCVCVRRPMHVVSLVCARGNSEKDYHVR